VTSLIVDASVAVKWVISEPGRSAAFSLLGLYEAERIGLAAPRLIAHEVASTLSKLSRRRKISNSQADYAFRSFQSHVPELVDDAELASPALLLSLQHQMSYWDCLYLALAIERRADLITADRRFYRSVARHYPFVKLLG
jgi:predicted nucleic acid-binding protein